MMLLMLKRLLDLVDITVFFYRIYFPIMKTLGINLWTGRQTLCICIVN